MNLTAGWNPHQSRPSFRPLLKRDQEGADQVAPGEPAAAVGAPGELAAVVGAPGEPGVGAAGQEEAVVGAAAVC